jgi:GDP-4-dehydro-6-deoxy-D-mannose reductase
MKTNKNTRILITGGAGLAGVWLSNHLRELGYSEIYVFDTIPEPENKYRISGSICDSIDVDKMLGRANPDLIFHLAGLNASKDPGEIVRINTSGTELLLYRMLSRKMLGTRILITSSSAVYGDKGKVPVTEEMRLEGQSPYAISKQEQERIAKRYFTQYGMPIIITRAFNNIAPGERETMLISKIAMQIAKIEAGQKETLEIGPLGSFRDYLDTRDLVDAYVRLIEKGSAGEVYNVCSEEAIKIEELFLLMLSNAKKKIPYTIVQYDQTGNIPFQAGSAKKLKDLTGWSKQRDVRKTVLEILDYWRERIITEKH